MGFFSDLISLFKHQPETCPTKLTPAPIPAPAPISVTPVPAPLPPVPEPPKYLFDTPTNSRHSIRVICDEEGLNLYSKEVITACIKQESGFINYKQDGTPLIRHNYNKKTGELSSTDWGLCQINDTPGWHIGPKLAFPSIQYVLEHPDKVVRYMIAMMKAGKLKLWVSYSSGAYEKYMPK